MTIEDLNKYEKWAGLSPVDILSHVRGHRGWGRVFPRKRSFSLKGPQGLPLPHLKDEGVFPEWVSRARNYFNETPISLKLLSPREASAYYSRIQGKLPTFNVVRIPSFGGGPSIPAIPIPTGAHSFALSGVVYLDETRKPWFEMDKVGSVYHYAGDVTWGKKARAALTSYSAMPVFKFIWPDGTGGSQELIVKNLKRQDFIGKVGEVVDIRHSTDLTETFRGSYNYSETIIQGLDGHDYRDIQPHSEDSGFYVNPDPYSSLESRKFPKELPGEFARKVIRAVAIADKKQ